MLYLNKYDIFQFPNIRQVDFLVATQLLKFSKELLQDNEHEKMNTSSQISMGSHRTNVYRK